MANNDVKNKIIISKNNVRQTFEGWGTALAWWGNAIGRWKDEGRKSRIIDLIFDPDEGLGMNIARYNIGGGENPLHDHMRVYADIPGFMPKPGQWDWEADKAQRWVLSKAIESGVNIVEAFSNSPPYWMTKSGCSAGTHDGTSNLKEENYLEFAQYLTGVVRHFKQRWGITFNTLSPVNEPISGWWKSSNNQEGCHFEIHEQEIIYKLLYHTLNEAGLGEVAISGPEENSIDDTVRSFSAYSDNGRACISQINTHSYEGTSRKELKLLAEKYGKKLWMSEVTVGGTESHNHDDMTSAFELAHRIIDDINEMEPAAWVYWQAVEDEAGKVNHGLIHANFRGKEEYWLTKQYFTMGNFCRFIRPGCKIIRSSDKNTLISCDGKRNSITVVNVNSEQIPKEYHFELDGFELAGCEVIAYRTTGNENLTATDSFKVSESSFEYPVKEKSVTTLYISLI